MSKGRRRRKRARATEAQVPARTESGQQENRYLDVVTAVALELDRRFGRAWRDDQTVVAEFGRVIMEECETRGIAVVEDGRRLQEKVFGPDLPASEQ